MERELLQQAEQAVELALKTGANDAIARVRDENSAEYTYRDGNIEQVQQSATRGLSIQLYVNGRYSTHQTSDLRAASVARFIEDAVALTQHLAEDPHRVIPDAALYEGRPDTDLQSDDAAVRDLPREACIDWLKKMDAVTHTDDRVVSATADVYYGWNTSARVSSNGFSGIQSGTSIGYGASVTLKEGAHGRPEDHRYVRAHHLSDLPDPEAVAREGLDRALSRLGSEKASSGRATMVVDPEAGGRLMGTIWGALQARSIQQNRSFLADKKDAQIANSLLTVTDDPLMVRGLASRHYDGEGISARHRCVVDQGVLQMYYVDTYYGRKLGWEPTTGMSSNLVFAPGEKDINGLIAEIGDGFHVTSWLGGNADTTTGDFSYGFRGFRIANGQKTGAVSEMNIAGNFLDLLENLVAVGNDPNVYSSMQTPTLVFDNVAFSGK